MIEPSPHYKMLPLPSLRLLVSPLQLMAAAMWGVVQHRAVMHYGLLEDLVTAVLDIVPELLSRSERVQLVLGLRAKLVLEMCRTDDLCCQQNIEPHLTRMENLIKEQNDEEASSLKMKSAVDNFSKVIHRLLDDPYERSMFYQETFHSVFGFNFDSALCMITRKFLMNLEKLLPVPNLDHTSQWLGLSAPVLTECGGILNQPEPLSELIQQLRQDYDFSQGPVADDLIFSSLSGPQDCDEEMERTIQLNTEEDEKQFVKVENDVSSVNVTLDVFDSEPQDCNSSVTEADHIDSGSKKAFKCFVCGETFDSLLELKEHIVPRCPSDTVERIFIDGGKSECLSLDNTYSANISDISEGQIRQRSKRIKTCSKCGKRFASSTDLMNHMKAHSEYSHICADCGQDFDNYENYMLHQENGCKTSKKHSVVDHHQEIHRGQIVMKECVVVLERIDDRTNPSRLCTISCKDCGQRVLNRSLHTHKNKCLQTLTNCNDITWIKPCNFISLTESTNNTEIDSESQLNQSSKESQSMPFSNKLECTLCNEAFSRIQLLKKHYNESHKTKGPYQCPVCKRTFVRLWELVKHHQNRRLFQCNNCKWCFKSLFELRKHKNQFNDTCTTVYSCEICGKHCASAPILKLHKYMHNKPKEKTDCSYCGKKFSSKHCLRVHMNRHTGGLSCPICSKVFFKNVYLRWHMNEHNGVSHPYLCEICGKDFPWKAYLKVHMAEHSKERAFKCDQCEMTYKSRTGLREHFIAKHTDRKPYVCSVCRSGYSSGNRLRDHMKKHTGERPHICSGCGKSFARKYRLKIHQQKTCFKRKL